MEIVASAFLVSSFVLRWESKGKKFITLVEVRLCLRLSPRRGGAFALSIAGWGTAVRAMLIERNLRLVVYIARKFENTGIHIEDLFRIGTIGLIKAVNTFDPSKKIKLATYASRCIENEILMFLRRNNKIRTEVSFDEPLNTDWDGNELLLSDVLGTENDMIDRNIEDEVDRKIVA